MAEVNEYDLIILDLMIPKLDGWGVLKRIRARGNSVPILILTARDTVDDKVKGLDSGCDDYLTKPFALRNFWQESAPSCDAKKPTKNPF